MTPWSWAFVVVQIILTVAGAQLLLWLRRRKSRGEQPPHPDDL